MANIVSQYKISIDYEEFSRMDFYYKSCSCDFLKLFPFLYYIYFILFVIFTAQWTEVLSENKTILWVHAVREVLVLTDLLLWRPTKSKCRHFSKYFKKLYYEELKWVNIVAKVFHCSFQVVFLYQEISQTFTFGYFMLSLTECTMHLRFQKPFGPLF